jgi:hypothetical protein
MMASRGLRGFDLGKRRHAVRRPQHLNVQKWWSVIVALVVIPSRLVGQPSGGGATPSPAATASRDITPVPLQNCTVPDNKELSDYLMSEKYKEPDNWSSFQNLLRGTASELTCNRVALDILKGPVMFRFQDKGGIGIPSAYRRVLVNPVPYDEEFQGQRLVERTPYMYDVHLDLDKSGHPTTTYSGAPVSNPIVGSLQKAAPTFAGGLAKDTWPTGPFKIEAEEPSEPGRVSVRVYQLKIPPALKRSMITVKETTLVPKDPSLAEELIRFKEAVDAIDGTNWKQGTEAIPMESLIRAEIHIWEERSAMFSAFNERLRTIIRRREASQFPEPKVEFQELNTLAAGLIIEAKATFVGQEQVKELFSGTYYFASPTHWQIGAGAAYIAGTSLNQQVKTNNSGVLIDDTPTNLLTYITLNWSLGYDESSVKPSWREGLRVFAGPALTPEPGGVIGLGLSPWWWPACRGFFLQAGYGVVLSNVLRNGDQIGEKPAVSTSPTRHGALGVLFIGFGYGL